MQVGLMSSVRQVLDVWVAYGSQGGGLQPLVYRKPERLAVVENARKA